MHTLRLLAQQLPPQMDVCVYECVQSENLCYEF